jgi:hypothetical protein
MLVLISALVPPVLTGATSNVPTANNAILQATSTDGRVAALEKEVATLQAQVKSLEAHTHTVAINRGPNYFFSIAQLRDAMVPHSNTDINVNWIPVFVSNGPPPLTGARTTTSGPVTTP